MFSKQGVCVATTAGAGAGSANRDMSSSLLWWGVGRRYSTGFAVQALKWDHVSEAKRRRIGRKMTRLAARIRRRVGRVRASLGPRLVFGLARMFRRRMPGDADYAYWESQGWLGKSRPWRDPPGRTDLEPADS